MRALVCQSERYIVALARLLLRFQHLSSTGQTGSRERVGFPRYESKGRRVLRGKERADVCINVASSEVRRCRVLCFAARKYLRYSKKAPQVATLNINAWSLMRAIYELYMRAKLPDNYISCVCKKKKKNLSTCILCSLRIAALLFYLNARWTKLQGNAINPRMSKRDSSKLRPPFVILRIF